MSKIIFIFAIILASSFLLANDFTPSDLAQLSQEANQLAKQIRHVGDHIYCTDSYGSPKRSALSLGYVMSATKNIVPIILGRHTTVKDSSENFSICVRVTKKEVVAEERK